MVAHDDTGCPESKSCRVEATQIAHFFTKPAQFLANKLKGPAETGHGRARVKRAAVTGLTSTIARVLQIGVSLITVPLTLKYLGAERFGLWMTISAVLAMASFADFGIGSGLLNVVSEAFGKDDLPAIRKAVSSGFAVMLLISVALLAVFFLTWPFIDWAHFFGVSSPTASAEAAPAIAVFAVCFALNIAMDVVQRVQLGLQQGYRYGMWQAFGSVAALCGVLAGVHLHVGLPMLLIAIAGGPVLSTTLNTLHFFGRVRPDLRPQRSLVSGAIIRHIASLGVLFFVLQVVTAVSFSADNLILARMLGAASVAGYSIPQRLFALISMLSSMLVAPLWPAYGEAMARGEMDWVGRILRKTLLLVLSITSAISAVTLLLAPWLLRRWVGNSIRPQFSLLLGLAVWTVIACGGDAVGVFLNAASRMRLQVSIATSFGIGCVLLKLYCVHRFGIAGLPWATVVAYLFLGALPFAVFVPRLLRQMQGKALPLTEGAL